MLRFNRKRPDVLNEDSSYSVAGIVESTRPVVTSTICHCASLTLSVSSGGLQHSDLVSVVLQNNSHQLTACPHSGFGKQLLKAGFDGALRDSYP